MAGTTRFGGKLQRPANTCQHLPTPANTCKELQSAANTCKELQSAAKTCKDLQNAAKRCKPLRDLQSAAKGFPELLWFMPDDMSALKEKSEKLDREEKEEWMRDLFGLRVKVPEHWFSGADRPWKWSSSSKPWGCKIVDADFDTAIEKDPKFLIQCDDPKWPNWVPIRYTDVRRFSQIKHAPVEPFPQGMPGMGGPGGMQAGPGATGPGAMGNMSDHHLFVKTD